ncbi:bifunctional MaoC family dehydratase N-terminal/OB-fold nucleic acid binding domain-containing protein [Amycolatopsis sp. CA-128772]|uniref:bifunctional MaoC family dehydratase N-terminal/OB-fold nucleic acid binding domain-containing protein n=1 Tax=Amycolatopsis sp. CA-128772 TaxID=2073159 RepID=UPI000CD0D615|nr:OB-fold domain-containing protein [Amycolatopsis sp. CA-128772]
MNIEEAAAAIAARGECAPRLARDPVNQAMVNNWVEAIGDRNPVYTDPEFAAASVHRGLVAPPAMVQVWTMGGLNAPRGSDDPLGLMMELLDEAGFTSVVATNSEQTYHRYLRPGEQVRARTRLESVAGPKKTALGEGWFVTTRMTWYVEDEAVAEMLFRVLKFRPAAPKPPPSPVLRPVISRDTEFFWAGLREGELRIQRWGETLRHPPGPMPPDGSLDTKPDYVVASGRGTVFSYVVHHHPPVPGKDLPFVVALVELEEGVRVLAELLDAGPDEVHIGLPVVAAFVRVDDDLTLPAWKVAR